MGARWISVGREWDKSCPTVITDAIFLAGVPAAFSVMVFV